MQDKLSSQKANSHPKPRNPSQVAQLRLTTNPPDSVKKFAIKKSIIGALENAATNMTMLQAVQEQQLTAAQTTLSSRNRSAAGLHRGSSGAKGGEKSVEKRQSQHNSFLNDQSLVNEQQF